MALVNSLPMFMPMLGLIRISPGSCLRPTMAYWKAPSNALRVAHTQKLADGALLSLRLGKWLNRFITINFDKAKLQSNARPFLRWYLKQCRDWLAYRDAGPLSYIAAFENKRDAENKGGFHVHLLMHVPYRVWTDFLAAEERWLEYGLPKYESFCRLEALRQFLWDEPVGNYEKYLLDHASERDYLKQLRRLVLYNLKGATQMDTPTFLGMDEDEKCEVRSTSLPSDQGRVWGRRVSVSHILLPGKASPPLRSGPRLPWLEEAEREADAGRDLHRATLKLGSPAAHAPAVQLAGSDAPDRRSR